MNREEYLIFHRHCCQKMEEITKAKSRDYANDNDPFANFSQVVSMGITTVEKGFLVRILDKISRINNYANHKRLAVLDESVEDTILDCANYLILLAGYIKSKEKK